MWRRQLNILNKLFFFFCQTTDQYKCIDTVSYRAAEFGRSDHVDNDCDGLVDEELCFAQFVNKGRTTPTHLGDPMPLYMS